MRVRREGERGMDYRAVWLKSIRVHLSPRSSCGLVAYTLRIHCTCATGHTAIF